MMRTPFSLRSLFTLLLLTAVALGGCVDARFKSSNSGSTGTVIDFGAPILMAVSIDPSGTGPYSLNGVTYRLSLWKRVKKDLSVTRYFVSDQAPGVNPGLAVEVTLGSSAGFIRAAQTGVANDGIATLNGFSVVTSAIHVLSNGLPIRALFTAIVGLSAVSTPGVAPSLACFANATNAFVSGAPSKQISVTSSRYTTTAPRDADVNEFNGLRSYSTVQATIAETVSVTVQFTLDGSGACQITTNVPGFGEAVAIGRSASPLTAASALEDVFTLSSETAPAVDP